MGAVLEVWDPNLNRRLALKYALGDKSSAEAGHKEVPSAMRIARLLEEAQICGQLDHPGIVPVHDLAIDESGRVFFTMRLVRGKNLHEVLELFRNAEDGWTLERVIEVLRRVCEAMAFAHEKGVIHRDLKPSNLMVGRFGQVYVMDWGLAKLMKRGEASAVPGGSNVIFRTRSASLSTRDGDILGTPPYMAPEQARGENDLVDSRSDVHAIGAILYEVLSGRQPYSRAGQSPSQIDVLRRLLAGSPTPLRELVEGVPQELVSICERAMQRDPDERYRNAGELGEDLRAYQEGRVVRAHRTGPWAELSKWVGRNRRVAALLLVGVPLVASLATYVFSTRDQVLAAELQARRAEVESLLATGFSKLRDDYYSNAIRCFEEALEQERNSAEARAGLALALAAKGEAVEALRLLDEDPNSSVPTPVLLGIRIDVLRELRRTEEARVLEAMLAEPTGALGAFLRGTREMELAGTGEQAPAARASEWFQRALWRSQSPRLTYFSAAADAAVHAGEEALARDLLSAMLQLWPDEPAAHSLAAQHFASLGDLTTSAEVAREAVERWPKDAQMMGTLGGTLYHQGEFQEARRWLLRCVEQYAEYSDGHALLSEVAFELGNPEEGEAHARAALEHDPHLREAAYNLGVRWLELGNFSACEEAAREALMIDAGWAPPHVLLGVTLDSQGRPEEALDSLREALRLNVESHEAWGRLGNVLTSLERFEEAEEAYDEALRLSPDDPVIHYDYGALLVSTGRFAAAKSHFQEDVRWRPSNSATHYSLGLCSRELGELEEAEREARMALELDESNGHAHALIAGLFMRQGRMSDALIHTELAFEYAPDIDSNANNLAWARAQVGDHEGAAEAYEELTRRRPNSVDAWRSLAFSLGQCGRWQDGLEAQARCVELSPDDPWILVRLAEFQWRAGYLVDAEETLQDLLQLDPEFAEAHTQLATLFAVTGRFDAALEEWRISLDLNPEDGMVHGYLGRQLMWSGHLEEAQVELSLSLERVDDDDSWSELCGGWLQECEERLEVSKQPSRTVEERLRLEPEARLREGLVGSSGDMAERLAALTLIASALDEDPLLLEGIEEPVRLRGAMLALEVAFDLQASSGSDTALVSAKTSQALDWLGEELDALLAERAAGTCTATEVRDVCGIWLDSPQLLQLDSSCEDVGGDEVVLDAWLKLRARLSEHAER